ncbi:MAG: cupin domain-containing protein [Clostridia bacterium]|nr:cupin domain-containing protein [Clostridia bacterium]
MEETNRIDYGNEPFIANITSVSCENPFYRRVLWTGEHLQVAVMSIPVSGEIGLEQHPDNDQFIRIESGCGEVFMGGSAQNLNIQKRVNNHFAVMVPAGVWHNIRNIGNTPLKVYTVYAPPHHPKGTVHETKSVSESEEN